MSVSYKKLKKFIEPKGMSLKHLYNEGVISHHAYRMILKDNYVSLEHIDSICQYLKLPIEEVVEIIPDEKD